MFPRTTGEYYATDGMQYLILEEFMADAETKDTESSEGGMTGRATTATLGGVTWQIFCSLFGESAFVQSKRKPTH